MDIYFKKTLTGLIPLYNSDKEAYDKIKIGDEVKTQITKPRNYQFHKKAMALLNIAYENQDEFEQFNHLRYWLTMKTGWVDMVPTPTGTMFIPKSISYASMDEYEFEEWYSKILDQVIKLIGADREVIENELSTFL